MAEVARCDLCGAVGDPEELPPFVEPCRWSTAVEDFTIDLCRNCQRTKTLSEILAHAHGTPGGVVDGAARGPYLVAPAEAE